MKFHCILFITLNIQINKTKHLWFLKDWHSIPILLDQLHTCTLTLDMLYHSINNLNLSNKLDNTIKTTTFSEIIITLFILHALTSIKDQYFFLYFRMIIVPLKVQLNIGFHILINTILLLVSNTILIIKSLPISWKMIL